MNLQSLQDRQELIEEIFDELEELILGRRNGSTDEIEDLLSNMNNNFLNAGPNNKFSNLPRTSKEWNSLSPDEKTKVRSRLLELLEEKKAQLTLEISNLDRIVQENSVEQ